APCSSLHTALYTAVNPAASAPPIGISSPVELHPKAAASCPASPPAPLPQYLRMLSRSTRCETPDPQDADTDDDDGVVVKLGVSSNLVRDPAERIRWLPPGPVGGLFGQLVIPPIARCDG
ncbi:hypothetical protein Vretimale_11852, partial [Volvox reticuliferus]